MRKYLLVLLTSAAIASCTALPAAAEEEQGGVVIVQAPHHPYEEEITGQSGSSGQRGMMTRGRMMERMMETGRRGTAGSYAPPMHPIAMHIIFALMDSDGDGAISLQEFQAAHERLFV